MTNLRNVLGILSDFYRLSGLKVSVSKTSAIWFGSAHDSTIKLCPDLSLNWSNTFTLLGIKFDSNLEHIKCVYTSSCAYFQNHYLVK